MAGLADYLGGRPLTPTQPTQSYGTDVSPIKVPGHAKKEGIVNKAAKFLFGSTIEATQDVNTLLGKIEDTGPVGKVATGLLGLAVPAIGGLNWQKYIATDEQKANSPWLQRQDQPITVQKVAGDVLGTAAELGSFVVPSLGAATAEKAVAGTGIKWLKNAAPYVGTATSGALWGGSLSAAQSISAGNNIQQSIREAGKGAIIGSVLGTGVRLAEPLLGAGLSRTATWLEDSGILKASKTLTKEISSVSSRYSSVLKKAGIDFDLAAHTMNLDADRISAVKNIEAGTIKAYADTGFDFNKLKKTGYTDLEGITHYGDSAPLWARAEIDIKRVSPDGTPIEKNGKTIIDFWDATGKDILEKAQAEGIPVNSLGDGYRSHDVLRKESLKPYLEPGDYQDILVSNLKREGVVATKEDGIKFILDRKRVDDKAPGWWKNNSYVDFFIKRDNISLEKVKTMLTEDSGKITSLHETGRYLERERILNDPLINPFTDEAMAKYVANSMQDIVYTKGLGGLTEDAKNYNLFADHLKAVRNYSKQEGLGNELEKELIKLQKITLKRLDRSPDIESLSRVFRDMGAFRLTFAQIQNITQGINNTALITDIPSMIGGVFRSFTKAGWDKARMAGAINDDLISAALMPGTAESGSLASRWLNFWKFGFTEKWNRVVTANAVDIMTEKITKQLVFAEKSGNKEFANYLRAVLGDFGLDANKIVAAGKLDINDINRSMFVGAGKAQFLSRPEDLPALASHPIGKLFFQFKSFGYMQTKLLKDELVKDLGRGKYGQRKALKTMLILTTIFPISTEVSQDIKSLITQKQRPTDALDRYLDDIGQSGAMGYLGDIYSSIKYKDLTSMTSPPSVGSLADIVLPLTDRAIKPNMTQAQLDVDVDQFLSAFGVPTSMSRTYGQWLGLRKKTKPKKELSSTLQSLGIVKK